VSGARPGGAEPARRLAVRFEGRVQGVGFRYAVCRLAEGRPVAGFVRNEDDGSVRLVAEGPPAHLRGLLDAIRSSPVGRHVVREEVRWSEAAGTFRSFGIGG
jgi:acylphosphatase